MNPMFRMQYFISRENMKRQHTTNDLPSVLLRGGVSRGVCSQKVLREFESFAARPSLCVPPPERQAANRWLQVGKVQQKRIDMKMATLLGGFCIDFWKP